MGGSVPGVASWDLRFSWIVCIPAARMPCGKGRRAVALVACRFGGGVDDSKAAVFLTSLIAVYMSEGYMRWDGVLVLG